MADAAPSPLDHINPVVRSSAMTANSVLKADTAGAPVPLTVPEGTLLGRATGGNVAALTAAQVATILSTPSSSPIGNLLTANQASVETDTTGLSAGTNGGTAASNATITRVVDAAATHGAAFARVTNVDGLAYLALNLGAGATGAVGTSGSIPVVGGNAYTFRADVKSAATTRNVKLHIRWFTSAGNVSAGTATISTAKAMTSSFAEFTVSGVAPATAAYASLQIYIDVSSGVGETIDVDRLGFWAGAGGMWAMPGVPIVNTGRRVTHPNTDDVLVEVWDSTQGRWQVAHYDSGWRDVATLLTSFTGTGDGARLRRVGGTVFLAMRGTFNGLSVNVSNFFTQPSGFTSSFNTYGVIGVVTDGATAVRYVDEGATGNILRFRTSITADGVSTCGWLSWPTSDAIPTSLPGTLVSSAPYN